MINQSKLKLIFVVAVIAVAAAVILPAFSAHSAKAKAEQPAEQAPADATTAPAPFPASDVPAAAPTAAPAPAQEAKLKPTYKTVTTRVCEPRAIMVEVDVPDTIKPVERNPVGMLLGGAAGALLGNQVGGGNGKTIATLAGAAAGAFAGDKLANNAEPQKAGTHKEQRQAVTEVCHDVTKQVRVN